MKILRLIFSKLVRKIYVIRGIKIRITGSLPVLTSAYKFGTIGTALLLKQQRFMRPFMKPVKRGAQNLPPRPTQENDSSPQKSKCEPLASGSNDFIGKMVGDPGIEPGVRLREGVTVPCHTLRPVAQPWRRRYPSPPTRSSAKRTALGAIRRCFHFVRNMPVYRSPPPEG